MNLVKNGERWRPIGGRTRQEAELRRVKEIEKMRNRRLGGGLKSEDMTFDELVKMYWSKVHPQKSVTTQRREDEILDHLEKAFNRMHLLEICKEDVQAYRTRRLLKVSPATVNREMILLSHMFSTAVDWEYMLKNPARMKALKEINRRIRDLSFKDAMRLVAACSGYLKIMVLVVLNSGLRRGELLKLQWGDIDFKAEILTVVNSKNGKTRHIPMTKALTRILRSITKTQGSPYVFCGADGKPFGSINMGFRAARERAGLKDVRFHDLRHTFASWLVRKGAPLAEVKELLGHSTYQMTLRYAHLVPSGKTKSVRLLDRIGNWGFEGRKAVA